MAFGGGALNKILGLLLIVVCLPIFAGLGLLSADLCHMLIQGITASAGIVSMGDIIIDFMPIFGIGAVFLYTMIGKHNLFTTRWIRTLTTCYNVIDTLSY